MSIEMEKIIAKADLANRPEFSRFKKNIETQGNLPIFPLTFPSLDGRFGVILVGDYIAQDLIAYMTAIQKDFHDKWIVLSSTQSDAVPKDCKDVDFNIFSNSGGVDEYLASPAFKVPYSTDLTDGHYVDPEIFFPNPNAKKFWDIFYPAKWYPTKKIEILLETARLDPELKIVIYGWPVVSERKSDLSTEYRNALVSEAQELDNVTIFNKSIELVPNHVNLDGSVVVGSFTKDQMRESFFWRTRSVICLSENTEAVNRGCTEALCCDIPILVASTKGGLEKLVNYNTGILIDRTAHGIVEGYNNLRQMESLNPRQNFLANFGKEKANQKLRNIVDQISRRRSVIINWDEYRSYGGDPWTSPSIYMPILNNNY